MSSDRRSTPRGLKRPHETPPSPYGRPARRQNIASSSAPPSSFNLRHPQALPSAGLPPHPEEGPQVLAESDFMTECDEDDSSQGHVILALDLLDNGGFGSAYYASVDDCLFVQQDTSGGMELVEALMLRVEPTVVLVPNRASDELVSYLEKSAPGINGSSHEGTINGAHIFRVTGSSEFEPHKAKARLTKLKLEPFGNPDIFMTTAGECDPMVLDEDRPHLGQVQASLRLGSLISLQSHLSIGCAGAVIGELQRRTASEYLAQDPGVASAHKITSVKTFSLADSMLVNQDTLDALQITHSESHPNKQMNNPSRGHSGAKEGLSVYGLFQKHACTPQGKTRLKRTFLRPSTDIQLLRERHRTVAVLARPENSETCHLLTKKLKVIQDMQTVMANVQKGVDKPSSKTPAKKGVWRRLQWFAKSSVEIFELVRNLVGGEDMARKMSVEVNRRELMKIGERISNTVDFKASGVADQTVVCHGVDLALDELRRQFSGMESFLIHVSRELASKIPQWATQYIRRCVYYRQLGFLTVIAVDPATGEPGYAGSGPPSKDHWEPLFVDDDGVYFKNTSMRELDDLYGDIESEIDGRQIEILHKLRLEVMAHKDGILSASRFWAELDSFVAMAGAAQQYGLSMPQMTDENVIDIKGGRHLLQELVVPSFIANDCQLAGGSGREGVLAPNSQGGEKTPSMLILTGPNHSGKSVFLKQVALIVYLAHVGSFVPAERARIGIVDKILTRFTTRESVTGDESAFATDLRQAAFAMSLATCRSLVLADEFGKGTNPIDGAALAAALFGYFATRDEDERPKVLAATHFHEIFEQGILDETPNISHAHMDVRVDDEATERENQMTFLYDLVPGRSTSSYGTWCALMNGVDKRIVKRAEDLSVYLAGGGNISAITRLSETEEKRLKAAERAAREFLLAEIATPSKEGGSGGHGDGPPAEQPRDLLKRILAIYDEVDVSVDDSGDLPPTESSLSEIS